MNNKLLITACAAIFVSSALLISPQARASDEVLKDQTRAVFLIEGRSQQMTSSGTGFACRYKDKEFVATNLHVIEGASAIKVTPQSGDAIRLSGKIIVAEDADICLLGISEQFAERGIPPFEFMNNVFEEAKAGDQINCLGNSLGNGVITATGGTIKAFGQPRLEIDCPTVKGNSGGPIIHKESGKVVGLVTEAIINKLKLDELGKAAVKSERSSVSDISYFGHRIDTVRKWSSTNLEDYKKASQAIETAKRSLECTTLFLINKDGWQVDPTLSEAWNNYSKFIERADSKKRIEVTDHVYMDDEATYVRRDIKVKGMGVSQIDFDKAYQALQRSIEWKIKADQSVLQKLKPLGFRQLEAHKMSTDFSTQVLSLQKEL